MAARVLFLNHVGQASGAEASLLCLLAHLDLERWQPTLAAPAGLLLDDAAALGIETHAVPFGRLRRRGGLLPLARSLGRLATAVVAFAPLVRQADLVHANSLSAALAALPAVRLFDKPLLWHCRDLRLPRRLVRLVAPHCAQVIAISQAVARELVACDCPVDRIRVVPNAIDPSPFAAPTDREAMRLALGCGPGDELVVCLGQLVPWKGQDRLLSAAALLAEDRPGLRLAIVGADLFGEHPDYLARLHALADRTPLAGRVMLTGYRDDVPAILAAADLLVLPSDGEPFGRVLLEAMCAAVPIVATAGGGTGEVVSHGRTGWMVRSNAPDELAAGLRTVLADPSLRARLVAAGRVEVRRRFTPARHAARVMAIYDEVLGRPGGKESAGVVRIDGLPERPR